jgi:hypothetical protein
VDITAELAPWLNVIDQLELKSESSAPNALAEDEAPADEFRHQLRPGESKIG